MSMPLYDQVRDGAHELIAEAAEQVAMQGMGFREALTEFGISLLADFMALVQHHADATGAEKKAAVLKLAADFYDQVIEPIDLPGPDVVIDPFLKAAWLKSLDWTIDGIVAWFKSIGVEGVLSTFRKSA
tara:strand:- start:42 stop:428 length:387 start_codon:yes stop_codon:yes gene_type:complete